MKQLGFQPGSAKLAVANDRSATALPWAVTDAGGTIVTHGTTTAFGKEEASGDSVHQIDPGSLTRPGDYRLTVGANTGHPFAISPETYGPLAIQLGLQLEPVGAATGRGLGRPQ